MNEQSTIEQLNTKIEFLETQVHDLDAYCQSLELYKELAKIFLKPLDNYFKYGAVGSKRIIIEYKKDIPKLHRLYKQLWSK